MGSWRWPQPCVVTVRNSGSVGHGARSDLKQMARATAHLVKAFLVNRLRDQSVRPRKDNSQSPWQPNGDADRTLKWGFVLKQILFSFPSLPLPWEYSKVGLIWTGYQTISGFERSRGWLFTKVWENFRLCCMRTLGNRRNPHRNPKEQAINRLLLPRKWKLFW